MSRIASALVVLASCSSPERPALSSAGPHNPAPAGAAPASAAPAIAPGPTAPGGSSIARVEPTVESIHGITVRDPYRWMERGGADLEAYLADQDAHARAALAAIPGRDQLRDAIHAANLGVTRVWIAGVAGSQTRPRLFIGKRAPTDETWQLYVRDGWTGTDRLVVDPRTRATEGVHYALDFVAPAPDGKHVAYGIAASGSEDDVIEIIDVDAGVTLPEKIDRAQYAAISWRDARSFFYWRRRAPSPGEPRADWFKNSATHLHVLGGDPEHEPAMFSQTMPELGLAAEDFTSVTASPRSPWALAVASPGTSADPEWFVAQVAQAASGAMHWRRLSGPHDHVDTVVAHGDMLYAVTYAGAPRYRLVAFDAAAGTLATAREIVPESGAVLESVVAAEDALYLQLFDAGESKILRVSYDGKQRTELPLPARGSAYIGGEPDRPGIRVYLTGWTTPPVDLAFEPGRGFRDLALQAPWPIHYDHLTSELVEVASQDGTKVPMSIIRRKDAKLDGSAPGLLRGYQAYGSINRPGFAPIVLTWVDRGGVFAECHGRGSGNRGKQWHLDGIKQNKERGVEDFLGCAQYLIAHGYTATSRLTANGQSAGGMLIGGAITRRPELFAAALLQVPMANIARFETTEGGLANVPELGSLAVPDDFRHILASDPYHRLVDRARYPAVLITGGMHDVRVPIWLQAKFAARLQAATGSGRPVLLRVERDAGHGIGSTRTQYEEEWADLYAFALNASGVPVAH